MSSEGRGMLLHLEGGQEGGQSPSRPPLPSTATPSCTHDIIAHAADRYLSASSTY